MKKSLLLLIVFSFSFCALWAQTKISGIVTDAGNGAPIGYATVAVKGTAVGVTTDAKGAYTIPIPKGTQTLRWYSATSATTRRRSPWAIARKST